MIDDVGYPVRCWVSSLDNHKLLQFLQHSRAPMFYIFHFPITSHSVKHSRLSTSYMERRSQTCHDNWQQSLLNVVAMVSFYCKSWLHIIAIMSTWSIKSQHLSSPGIKLPFPKYYLIRYSKEKSETKSSSSLSFAHWLQYLCNVYKTAFDYRRFGR